MAMLLGTVTSKDNDQDGGNECDNNNNNNNSSGNDSYNVGEEDSIRMKMITTMTTTHAPDNKQWE